MDIFLHQHFGCLADAGVGVSTGTRKATLLPAATSNVTSWGGVLVSSHPLAPLGFQLPQNATHAYPRSPVLLANSVVLIIDELFYSPFNCKRTKTKSFGGNSGKEAGPSHLLAWHSSWFTAYSHHRAAGLGPGPRSARCPVSPSHLQGG